MIKQLLAVLLLCKCQADAFTTSPTVRVMSERAPTRLKGIKMPLRMSGGEAGDPKGGAHFGFLGMGIMGIPMAKNLIKAGYSVTVWNRTPDRCLPLVECGALQASSPAEVVKECDITFAMLADPQAAKDVVYGTSEFQGVLTEMREGKAYVDVSTVSDDCSKQIAASILDKGGRFLEAPVSGSKKPAEDGTLIFLCAGDQSLYKEVTPALDAMGKKSVFLGEVGAGAKMKLVVNMIMTSMLTAFSEGMALASSAGLQISDLLDVVDSGAIASPMFKLKGPLMDQGKYDPAFPLKHARKDINLALLLASQHDLDLPVSAAASQQYLKAEAKGAADLDFSAVHQNYQESGKTELRNK